jgi:serine/threonine-protein kinase
MNDPHHTIDDASSTPADSLDAGLAAGFGPLADGHGSLLTELRGRPGRLHPVPLGDSTHVVLPSADAMPPAQAGDRYQLFGEIARGGMGAVLRGRDVYLGRDLAVKVLLEKYADCPDVARRFVEEAQIGGQLQHPGVVPIYDIGYFDNRPFFTMKLVKGQTLAALLAERQDPAQDRPRFLSIALQVARTLAYTHAHGVIHRDLKPANIMVGAFGEVQVMDWGLAKVLAEDGVADEQRAASREHARAEDVSTIRTTRSGSVGNSTDTQAGSLMGSPAYMPPEQANGDVALLDRRADVFGLGAILCEILTGQPPYVGRSGAGVRRKAANGDLADAQARLASCGADAVLVDLTRACLAPEPSDRPRDAQAVAGALTAYLDGVQERLRQAELAEAVARARALEEAKRRRLTLALATTVLLALILGGGGWVWLKTDHDARLAQVTREVNDAVNKATALREQAKAATLGGADPFAQAREQTQRALALAETGRADEALNDQVRKLQAELDQEAKDRQLLIALDEACLAQATLAEDRRRFASERAVPLFRSALANYGMPAGAGEPAAVAARLRQRPAQIRETVLAVLDEWLDLAADPKLAINEPHRDWLQAVLVAAEPEDGWTRRLRAASSEPDMAQRRAALQKLAEEADIRLWPARSLTRLATRLQSAQAEASALRLLRRAQQRYPADFWVNLSLGMALQATRPPQWEEAARFLTAALALRPDSAGTYVNLGKALSGKGQMDEAIACYRQALVLDPRLAQAHNNLGIVLQDKRQLEEAIACYRKALELEPNNANAHNNLGAALQGKGQLNEAILCYRQALALDPRLVNAHTGLGTVLAREGKANEAIASYKKALALDPKDTVAHFNLGMALQSQGQVDEAIACFRRALELDPRFAPAHHNLGFALAEKGRLDEAIACYRQALALDPRLANAHIGLGTAMAQKGDVEGAIACYRKAIALDPQIAQAHVNLGNALASKAQADEAIACYRRALALDPKLANAYGALGQALLGTGRYAEARDALARALALLSADHPVQAHVSRQLQECERLLRLEARLPGILRGENQPASARENLDLAQMCGRKKLHAAAARLWATALAADAKLAEDLHAGHRYHAACAAALAAAGQSEDVGKLDDKERTRLRQQAHDWLRADLALLGKQLASGQAADRAIVRQTLRRWQQDGDLAGLHDAAALAKLSADERAAFAQLWADVAALLQRAGVPR